LSSIHHHFASKEALWSAAVDRLFAQLARAMDGLDFAARPGRRNELESLGEKFGEMIRRFVRFAAEHRS
jgi:TetR/AcrR family transcriptional regulator